MHPDGFIVLWRRMPESWIWQLSPSDFKIAVTCLFMANWTDGKWFDGQEMIFIPRGTFISSVENISKEAGKGITSKMVRGCLRRLSVAEFLKMGTQRGKRYSVVTIINYEEYQTPPEKKGKRSGELGANSGQEAGELGATIEPSNQGTKEPRNQISMLDSSSDGCSSAIPLSRFEAAYSHYPRKQGKTKGLEKAKILIKTDEEFKLFGQCIMAMEKAWEGYELAKCPHFSTFVNQRRWNDEVWPLPNSDTPAKGPEYVNGQRKLPPPKAQPPQPDRPGETREEWEARMSKEREVES